MAMPEARAMQAVPLNRIPSPREVKIFLSHKSVDKPLVYRYYHTLKEVGFDPWLGVSAAAPPHMRKEQGQPARFVLSSWADRGSS